MRAACNQPSGNAPVHFGLLEDSVNTDGAAEVQEKQRAGRSALLCTSEEAKTHQTAFLLGADGENSANLFVLDLIEAKML